MRSYVVIRWSIRTVILAASLLCCSATYASELSNLKGEIEAARSGGQTAQLIHLLLQQGEQLRIAGYLRDAQPVLREAVDLSLAYESLALRALAMSALGQLYATPVGNPTLIGNWSDPKSLLTESTAIAAQSGDSDVVALVAVRMGEWLLLQGEHQDAANRFQRSITASKTASNAGIESLALSGLARAQIALRRNEKALKTLEAAIMSTRLLLPQDRVASNLSVIRIAHELPDGKQLWAAALKENDTLKEQLTGRLLASHYGEMGRWFEQEQETDVSLREKE